MQQSLRAWHPAALWPVFGLIAVALTLGVLAGGAPDAHAQAVTPSFVWSMPDRLADHDGDGFIDSSVLPSQASGTCEFVPPREGEGDIRMTIPCHPEARNFVTAVDGFTVNLDACDSVGAIATYRWLVDGERAGESAGCDDFSLNFPREGVYTVTLVALPASGGPGVSVPHEVTVQDWLIVAFGDSYGSGEGAPDRDSLLFRIADTIGPAWVSFSDYLDAVANNCSLAFDADLAEETVFALSDTLLDEGLTAFLSALSEVIETGADAVEVCGSSVVGIVEEFETDLKEIATGFEELGEEVFGPITSLTLRDLWPAPIETVSDRLNSVRDNFLAAIQPLWQDEN